MRGEKWLQATALGVAILAAPLSSKEAIANDLIVGFTQDALTLDPANHRKRETETIIRNMCDGVMTQTAKGDVVPELVEQLKQVDAKTYEAKLRSGVKFHSGDEMTAEDIKFTFDRLTKPNAMGNQTSPRKDLLGPLEDTVVVDKSTVQFKLSAPWPVFPRMLPVQEVVSKKFVETNGNDALASKVNCTGPFQLTEWRRGDSIIMSRFNDYYGGAPAVPPAGKASVDRVIFKIIPENASRVAALLAGQVHIINEVPISSIAQIERSGRAKVLKTNGTRSFFIALNVTRPPFNDVRVRRAANHALDKTLLITKLLGGTATPISGVLSPESFGFKPNLTTYDYNVEKAKALLAEAGLQSGFDVTLDTEGAFKDTAEAIAAMLSRVGIRTKVQVWEGAVLTPLWRKETKERDMLFASWGSGALDPTGIFVPTLKTKDRGNSSGYSNKEVDALLDAAETEIDQAKRAEMYNKAEQIVAQEAPWIFLWVPQDVYGVSNRLSGWEPGADSRINLHRATLN
jgi:peptide/nickel transport system substrate-binding protein